MNIFNIFKKRPVNINPNTQPMAFQYIKGEEPTECKVLWKDVKETWEMNKIYYVDDILVFPASDKFLYVTWPLNDEDYVKEISLPAINPKESLKDKVKKLRLDFESQQKN